MTSAAARASARRGWGVVAGAFGVMFAAFGCTYSFPAFFSPLQATFGASRGELSWVLSLALSSYFVIGAVSGTLADRFGSRRMALFGTTAVAIGLFVAASAQSLWQVYLGYGVGLGLGVGFAYVPSVGAVQRWFVRRRGLVSGLAVSGIGVGTLVMPKLAEWIIDAHGWRVAYAILGLIALIGGGAAALLVDDSPQRHGLLPDGGVAGSQPQPARSGMALRDAVRSRPFILLYVGSLCISLGLFMPFVHLAPFAEDRGVPHATAVTLFTLVGVGSTLGRFALGGLADRLGRRNALAAMYAGIGLSMLWWLRADQVWQIALFALVFGTCYGGLVALAPALIVDYFGERNASGLIGLVYTSIAFGTLAGPPLAGYAFDYFGSYAWPIAASAGAALVGAALIRLAPEPKSAPL